MQDAEQGKARSDKEMIQGISWRRPRTRSSVVKTNKSGRLLPCVTMTKAVQPVFLAEPDSFLYFC